MKTVDILNLTIPTVFEFHDKFDANEPKTMHYAAISKVGGKDLDIDEWYFLVTYIEYGIPVGEIYTVDQVKENLNDGTWTIVRGR